MITTKQRAYLRGIGTKITPTLQIGKDGAGDYVCQTLTQQLAARELVKASILQNCSETSKEIAEQLSKSTNCDIVAIIGRKILLYKESKKHIYDIKNI